MDAQTRYSAGRVCENISVNAAVHTFQTVWVSPFRPPISVQGDDAFSGEEFSNIISDNDIELRPYATLQHSKLFLNLRTESYAAYLFVSLRWSCQTPRTY